MFVGIIWRESADRISAFRQTVDFYLTIGADIHFFDSGHHPFNRAATRNLAVRTAAQAGFSRLVVSDADCIPEERALLEAWSSAVPGVHLPYTDCIVHDAAGYPLGQFGFTCGGTYVTTPEDWFSTGGQDERFDRWGPEDFAFKMAQDTLNTPMVRHEGTLRSLGHERDNDRHTDSEADPLVMLYRRYEKANGHREAMRVLCFPS